MPMGRGGNGRTGGRDQIESNLLAELAKRRQAMLLGAGLCPGVIRTRASYPERMAHGAWRGLHATLENVSAVGSGSDRSGAQVKLSARVRAMTDCRPSAATLRPLVAQHTLPPVTRVAHPLTMDA